ncbi:MAG: hypothetical protein IJW30_01875 [Clostridia bacterium]|nr:hypothetical protein [Clostridia bacterium]
MKYRIQSILLLLSLLLVTGCQGQSNSSHTTITTDIQENSVLDETNDTPDNTSGTPDDMSSIPDDTSSTPDDTSNTPNDTGNVPDDTSSTPDDTSSIPGDTSSTPPQEDEPVVFEPQLYVPYMFYSSFNDEAINERIDSLIGSTIQLSPEVFPGTETIREVESDIPDVTWEWAGYSLVGTYQYTEASFDTKANHRMDKTRYYKADGYGTIGYDVATGDWVRVSFGTSAHIDQNPSRKLSQAECKQIALAYINDYVETIGTDIVLTEYTLRETGLQGQLSNTGHDYYNFVYEKYIGDSQTYEKLYCAVTEYGSLVHFMRGESFASFESAESTIDYTAIHTNMNQIAEAVCAVCSDWDMTYKIDQHKISKLNNGSYIFTFYVYFQYTEQNVEREHKMFFRVPVL